MPRSLVTGGKRLKAFIQKAKTAPRTPDVEIGFYSSDRHLPSRLPMPILAIIHEFGSQDGVTPEQPYFRNAIQTAKTQLTPLIIAKLGPTLSLSASDAKEIGEAFKKILQASIKTAGLVDSGQLVKSVKVKLVHPTL